LSNRQESNNEKEKIKQPKKKVTVNLFIEEDVVNSLRKDALNKGISLNAWINAILSKYVYFYKRAEEYESCIITSRQFSVFLESMDEDSAAEIMSSDGTAAIASYMQHHNMPITLENVIEFTFEKMVLATGVCTKFSQHIDQDGFRVLVFDHRYGIKWSRIISKVFSYLLEKTCGLSKSPSLLPNTVSLKVLQKL
jgi:hypothetical protein